MEQKPAEKPRVSGAPGSPIREEAPLVAQSRFETPTPRGSDGPIIETPSAKVAKSNDRRAAARLVLGTMAIALVASAVLEYEGWQIAFRAAKSPTGTSGIPAGGFLRGVLDTFSGALAVGAAAAVGATLIPASWKRPLRALAAGFAVGAAGFLAFLAYLTTLAN